MGGMTGRMAAFRVLAAAARDSTDKRPSLAATTMSNLP
jgi:hypothetical protein